MSKKYLLGIDNGGTTIKAALFDVNGTQIAVESANTPLLTPRPKFVQRGMQSVRDVNFSLISKLCSTYGGENIIAVGVTGHGKGLYILDRNKKVLYDGIASTDGRAMDYEQKWVADGTAEKVYSVNAQKVLACQPVALLRWLKDNERKIYNNIGYIFSVKDYVRFLLTGEIYNEYTDVSGSNLLNLRTNRYDLKLTELFGIPEMDEALPPIIRSDEVCGTVTAECASQTGLKAGIPVVGGMFDIDACAVAMGAYKPGDMCIIAGTWSINEYISDHLIDNHTVSMNSVFCDPHYYLAEESSATSTGNLSWFREWMKNNTYAVMDEAVASLSPEKTGPCYLPFLYGSNESSLAKAAVVGLEIHHTDADLLRAVYEGVAFSHLTHINELLKSRPVPKCAKLAGGIVNSSVWSGIFADTLGFELELTESTELGAKGAAMAAGIGAGLFNGYAQAIEACVQPGKIIEPDAYRHEIYAEKYQNYRAVADALAPVWQKL